MMKNNTVHGLRFAVHSFQREYSTRMLSPGERGRTNQQDRGVDSHGLTPGVLCWLASRVPVVLFHGCWNLLSSHGEPGTRLRVQEAHTALPGEGATRAPLIEQENGREENEGT